MILTVRTGAESRTIELTGRIAGVVQRILNAGGRGCPASLLPGDVENTLAHFGIRLARAGERSRERVMIANAVAADLANLSVGRNWNNSANLPNNISQAEAAEIMGVSRSGAAAAARSQNLMPSQRK